MKEYLPEIDDLIAKVLTDEASVAEQAEFKAWVEAAPDNRHYFDELKRVWDSSTDALNTLDVDTDTAWLKVQQRIHVKPKPLTISWLSTKNILRAAAAIAILFTAFQYFKTKETIEEKVFVAQNTVQQDTLTDGSVITLNKKTQLTTVFSKKERRVKLQGEAYFAVAPDKEKPFVIEVKTLEVKVVGTAFKVDDQSLPNKIVVVVEEGIVEVISKRGEIKRLTKGDKAIYDTRADTFELSRNEDKNAMFFKTKLLEFDGTPLKDAVAKINDYYGSSVEIVSPVMENCPVSSPFDLGKQSVDSVIEVIKDMYHFEVEKKDNKILLKGGKCDAE
jgi:transmembrane sensor